MKPEELLLNIPYRVTRRSKDRTFELGDHICRLSDGAILCTEQGGWIDAKDVKAALVGVNAEVDREWLEGKVDHLRRELAALESIGAATQKQRP